MIYFMANEEVLTDEMASVEHVATAQKHLSRRVQQRSKEKIKKDLKSTLFWVLQLVADWFAAEIRHWL